MDQQAADTFFDQLANSPVLRAQFREDPAGTLEKAGVEGGPELVNTDWSQVSDEELAQRVSKAKRFH